MAPGSHFDGGSDFVLERFSPDGLATFTQAGGITGLNHEGLDVAVKNAAIVIVGSTKGQKVLQRGSRGERVKHMRIIWDPKYTSAALGAASQKTSILRSPREVWRVTDCSDHAFVSSTARKRERPARKFTMAFRVSAPDGGGVGTEGDE